MITEELTPEISDEDLMTALEASRRTASPMQNKRLGKSLTII